MGLSDGALAQITASRGTAEAVVESDARLQPGYAALPNGFGLDLPTEVVRCLSTSSSVVGVRCRATCTGRRLQQRNR
ncbi:hypothetical protein ACFXI6_55380 [Streptomyces mirabilis]|uniref:hypothetical protein n=1 Tax=Streptomyces mirabilis TaxID=68239 RepID=UPI0036771663